MESKARAEKYLFRDIYTKISNLDEQIQNGTKAAMMKQATESHERDQSLRNQITSICKEQVGRFVSIRNITRVPEWIRRFFQDLIFA